MSTNVLSQPKAKALVERITQDHKYLGEDVLRLMTPDIRRTVEARLIGDYEFGDAVTALANNLESSTGDPVFELLRNADENNFTRARARNDDPFVTFKIAPSSITVECNEDGFAPESLEALCAIGRSFKDGNGRRFLSSRGIGFKSVFTIAHKVHIQSGNFSFSFNHRRGQSGMGMISPTWEDLGDHLPLGITRIKLFLNPITDEAAGNSVAEKFDKIDATHLLFLRNLKCIKIIHLTDSNVVTLSRKFSVRNDGPYRMAVTKEKDGVADEANYYHTLRYDGRNVPRDKNKIYAVIKTIPESFTANIVFAFPLDKTWSSPIISSQPAFASSRLGNKGFKFLIQADFVTQTDGQDIDAASSTNQALLGRIAAAFANAVKALSKTEPLQSTWMRYLPQKNHHQWEGYWKSLFDRMKTEVQHKPLMRSLSEAIPCMIQELRRPNPLATDENGGPLFDGYPYTYPSRLYLGSDLDCLDEYGLKVTEYADALSDAAHDLRKIFSRIKSAETDDRWHTAAAKFLNFALRGGTISTLEFVRDMELIPLANGSWTKASAMTIPLSFPTTGGFAIPQDLPLAFICPIAAQNVSRAALFKDLGAREQPVPYLRNLVFNRYPRIVRGNPFGVFNITEDNSRDHLRFLYLTHSYATFLERFKEIPVFTEIGIWRTPLSQDVYIPDTHQYGVRKLLTQKTNHKPPTVDFLSTCYSIWLGDPGWVDWLQTTLGIRTSPRFVDNNGVTNIFRYILEHQNDQILGVICHYWSDIARGIEKYESLRNDIATSRVPCGNELVELRHTFLPLPNLLATCSQFLDEPISFPFVSLPNALVPEDPSSWIFLSENFGVGNLENMVFYLELLAQVAKADHPGANRDAVTKRVFKLYETLYKVVSAEISEKLSMTDLRSMFKEYQSPLIFLPVEGNKQARWKKADDCRLDCPMNMKTLIGLQSHYATLRGEEVPNDVVMTLMRDVLGISDLSADDIVNELRFQRREKNPNSDLIQELYQWLSDILSRPHNNEKNAMKEIFRTDTLIFVAGKWHTTGAFVWSSQTKITNKISLSHHYPNMKTTFVNLLGVSTLDVYMAYEELWIKGGSNSTTVDEMKAELWQFNSLLPTVSFQPLFSMVMNKPLFPVRCPDGSVKLLSSASSDFVVVDRKPLEERFRGLAKMLDFTLDEVRRLQPLLKWADMDGRRLSVKVTEVADVPQASVEVPQKSRHDIKYKAYPLCRIANHFGSPRAENPKSLYELLKRCKVFMASSIKSELQLIEDGRLIKVDQTESNLCLENTDDTLKIYVPSDARGRDISFLYDLPRALFKWMMEDSLSAIGEMEIQVATRVITNILNGEPYSLELLMDIEGIIELEFPEDTEEILLLEYEDRISQPSGMGSQPTVELLSDQTSTETVSSVEPEKVDENFPQQQQIDVAVPASGGDQVAEQQGPGSLITVLADTGIPSRPSTPKTLEYANTPEIPSYAALLRKVIRAGQTKGLPHKGEDQGFDMSALAQSLTEVDDDEPDDMYFNHYISKGNDRNYKMGAAGELYVFELLSALKPPLPDFSQSNWMSTIKQHIQDIPEYSNTTVWYGQETADIVYTDSEGVLTAALVNYGYLDEGTWVGRKPRYYIEVKATVQVCKAPFYMSTLQYDRMCDISRKSRDEDDHEAVYIIFRVFDLGLKTMGCKLYVDPYRLQERGELKFTYSEKWNWRVTV